MLILTVWEGVTISYVASEADLYIVHGKNSDAPLLRSVDEKIFFENKEWFVGILYHRNASLIKAFHH